MPRAGRTSPKRRNPRPTPRSTRGWKANSRNIFLRLQVPVTDLTLRFLAGNLTPFRSSPVVELNPNPGDTAENGLAAPRMGHKSLIFAENVLYWAISKPNPAMPPFVVPMGSVQTSNRGVAVPRAGCVTENA